MNFREIVGIAFLLAGCKNREADARDRFAHARAELRVMAVGCWVLADANAQRVAGRLNWVPPIAQLESTIVSNEPDGPHRRIQRLDTAGHALPLFLEAGINGVNDWTADARSDTLRLVFNNAFSGSVFHLRLGDSNQNPDAMRGRVYEFSDAGPRGVSYGSAIAWRVPCPPRSDSARDGV